MTTSILNIIFEALRNSIMITGLVVVMMIMIEYLNIESHGKWFSKLRDSKPRQILTAAVLGIIPGCVGGFAAVSLYTHGLISIGALTAMMACSAGDESFVILATMPQKAPLLYLLLFGAGIAIGFLTDYVFFKKPQPRLCPDSCTIHTGEDNSIPSVFKRKSYNSMKHPSKERIIIMAGITIFIIAIFAGFFEEETPKAIADGSLKTKLSLNIFNEKWLDIIFAIIGIAVIFLTATAKEHFIKEHIWHHLIKKHLLPVFLWSFGALLVCGILFSFIDLNSLISSYMPAVILAAVLIGLIPESGPHMIFVLLCANGTLPFYVLFVNSLVQEGHVTLPLLAESKSSWLKSKGINAAAGLVAGFACWLAL